MNEQSCDAHADTPSAGAVRARTLIVRCWVEEPHTRAARMRGTLRDISGGNARAFEHFDGLVAQLRTFLSDEINHDAGALRSPPSPLPGD